MRYLTILCVLWVLWCTFVNGDSIVAYGSNTYYGTSPASAVFGLIALCPNQYVYLWTLPSSGQSLSNQQVQFYWSTSSSEFSTSNTIASDGELATYLVPDNVASCNNALYIWVEKTTISLERQWLDFYYEITDFTPTASPTFLPSYPSTSSPTVLIGNNPYEVLSYEVSSGPSWESDPPTYSCVAACALLFGGSESDYQGSVESNMITTTCSISVYGEGCDSKDNSDSRCDTYNADGCASAYVNDECQGKTNYCFKSLATNVRQ